ncbi:hypothetical protein CHH62_05425 [Niallia circulans]|uniref:hypothetical protein n=1 Tax=Niallia circulans TaxID=1397 RepID=UPI000BA64C52|nr:hypothetical protein [Niallia circulans]PAD26809.1 hypothetical protein CHH62_05425 [Niallia circulans]
MNKNLWAGFILGIAVTIGIGLAIIFIGDYSVQKEIKTGSQSITEEGNSKEEKSSKIDGNNESEGISYSIEPYALLLKKEDGSIESFNHDSASSEMKPVDYSPTRKKVLLTPQYGWEAGGALYVYSKEDGLKEIINVNATSGEQEYPSGAVWLDERYILYMNSNLYGTIPSGELKIYDTETKRQLPLDLFKGDAATHLARLTSMGKTYIVIGGIQFTDDMLNDTKAYVEQHDLEEILKLVE